MKSILKYLWQLPQNILGLLVIFFSKASYDPIYDIWNTGCHFGVSLGRYVILYARSNSKSIKHEQGHQKQSLYLGWLYLLVIGLPSATGNLIDRWFHKKWTYSKRTVWYYSQPWEHWADKLGGVIR